MKRSIFKSILLSVLAGAFIFSLHGCKGNKAEMIARKWSVQDFQFEGKLSDEEKTGMEQAREMMKTVTYDFHADKTFEISMMGFNQKGAWKVNADTLTLKGEGDQKETASIINEISKEKLVLSIEQMGKTARITLVPAAATAKEEPKK